AQASLLIDRLNGAKPLLNDDARPISAGQFFRFGPDEKPMPFFIAAIGHITLGVGRARGRIEVISTEPPAPPKPSLLQAWLQAADHDDARSDLFTHLARCDNWYDIYKAAEIIRRIAGNKHKLDALLGSDKVEWERVWRTANTNRHAPDPIKYAPPTNPATLSDARGMILRAAGLVV
ncbi:MAG: hypothetical protein LH610_01805, partial [Sphingomonas bacterium]|nr:hypothetical protein [Sphingomonas bacterium]